MFNNTKIKPSGFIQLSPNQAKTHISKSIRRELEVEAGEAIPYVANAHTIVLFNPKLSKEEIIRSLQIVIQDLDLRQIKQEEGHTHE